MRIAEEITVKPTFSDNGRELRKKRCFNYESKENAKSSVNK